MRVETRFINHVQYDISQVSAYSHSNRWKKCRSTKEKLERPKPITTEHAWMAYTLVMAVVVVVVAPIF
jgi:hypothetical protein